MLFPRSSSPSSASAVRACARVLGRAASDRRGGVALAAAVLVPIFAVLVAGAVELEVMYKDRLHTQDVADTAALFGAQQLGVAPDGAAERTKAFALAQLESLAQRSDVAVSAVLADKSTLKVAVDTHRASFSRQPAAARRHPHSLGGERGRRGRGSLVRAGVRQHRP